MDELDAVADDLDAAISRLQDVALDGCPPCTMTDSSPLPFIHWAWSETEHRWTGMTFHEHQAWLARPDLDPCQFRLPSDGVVTRS